jgi:putative restriction endonuclease
MPIAAETVEKILINSGFVREHEIEKTIRYGSGVTDQYVYINKESGNAYSTIIIHPKYESERNSFLSIHGVNSSQPILHKAGMGKFPKRMNGGKNPIPYGIPFGFDNSESCKKFISKLVGKSDVVFSDVIDDIKNQKKSLFSDMVYPDAIEDFENQKESLLDLSETERNAVIKSRIGQGLFRELLIQLWGGCAITGIEYLPVLRASHIKPWRNSSNSERLDPENGLLLTPNFDVLFDRGFISFDELGEILISKELDGALQESLGLHKGIRLREVSDGNKKYLYYHRDNVFS